MRFLADENVDREIVVELRSRGHKVAYVAEMEPGISDDELSFLSAQEIVLPALETAADQSGKRWSLESLQWAKSPPAAA